MTTETDVASPDLTDNEINAICNPLTQSAAQVRYLRSLGLNVARRPDGRPLVNRAHYDAVRGGTAGTSRETADDGIEWSIPA